MNTYIFYEKYLHKILFGGIIKLEDLDLEVLKRKGYTYDTYFPEADDLAKFIVKAVSENKNIVCQCEYGQSRSAGCAGGVLGISFWQTADYCEFPQVNSKNYPLIYVKNRGLPKESP